MTPERIAALREEAKQDYVDPRSLSICLDEIARLRDAILEGDYHVECVDGSRSPCVGPACRKVQELIGKTK